MKANELSCKDLVVGDWVMVYPWDETPWMPKKITDINFHSWEGTDFCDWVGVEGWDELSLDQIKPIPLTPEILEKNGFVANKHVYPYPYYEYTNEEDKLKIGFAFPQGERTSYKEPWVYIDSERVFVEHLPCIFVHQLQQALRLCGINHEIIL